MALPVITPENFEGTIKIVANGFKQTDLERYINTFRFDYLKKIVGYAAFELIQNETAPKWDDLINGVGYTDAEGKRKYYSGLFVPLLMFIYFEYVRDNFVDTQTGQVKALAENSERVMDLETANVARARYNKAVTDLNYTLPGFLKANEEITTQVTAFTDNADNTYLLEVGSTKYLSVGDNVTISGEIFEVLAVVENGSITIQADVIGLDFTDKIVLWKPFEAVEFCELEYCNI